MEVSYALEFVHYVSFVKVVDNFPFVFNSTAQEHYSRPLILGFMSLPFSVIEYHVEPYTDASLKICLSAWKAAERINGLT